MKYGEMDISVLEITLATCNKTEIPPNPNKKAVKIILIEIALLGIKDNRLIPFVISKIPTEIALENLLSIPKKSKIYPIELENILIIWLFSNIETITENSMINPPIKRTVEVAFFILFPNISPKSEKCKFLLEKLIL